MTRVTLNADDERALAAQVRAGDPVARKRMIEAFIPFVWWTIKRVAPGGMGSTFFKDITQEGMLGLIEAVDRFDHRRNIRFQSYAVWWIRCYLFAALSQRNAGPLSIGRNCNVEKVMRNSARIRDLIADGYEPTDIAKMLGLQLRSLEALIPILWRAMPSLDAALPYDNVGRMLSDVVPDERVDVEREIVERDGADDELRRFEREMAKLDPREEAIVRGRGKGESLVSLGRRFRVSRERARQIHVRAVEKLQQGVRRGAR